MSYRAGGMARGCIARAIVGSFFVTFTRAAQGWLGASIDASSARVPLH